MLDTSKQMMLIEKALEAREHAYAPFSGFFVGAALLSADGEIFLGANIENSSYGGTICAERSAFAAAISTGKREFVAIAIVGGKGGEKPLEPCAPCGICRQFMAEFCSADFPVILYDGKSPVCSTLGELLPYAFKL
ncbi:MAG: cytidine deaminase [Clostridia bacterium]|nr:cytidine deaminase [Clostridia bacterium]